MNSQKNLYFLFRTLPVASFVHWNTDQEQTPQIILFCHGGCNIHQTDFDFLQNPNQYSLAPTEPNCSETNLYAWTRFSQSEQFNETDAKVLPTTIALNYLEKYHIRYVFRGHEHHNNTKPLFPFLTLLQNSGGQVDICKHPDAMHHIITIGAAPYTFEESSLIDQHSSPYMPVLIFEPNLLSSPKTTQNVPPYTVCHVHNEPISSQPQGVQAPAVCSCESHS